VGKKIQFTGKTRYELLDTIRGTMLISMMVYHACWNFVYIYGLPWRWYETKAAYLWQQSICWTFILLSGFCFSLGKRHLKSGGMVFAGGAVVTLITMLFMPSNRVVFGVLTCIGSCILLLGVLEKGLRKIPVEWGLTVSFFLFLLFKNINSGYISLGKWKILELPREWYQNLWTSFWGFPHSGFYSTDYFSVFPWIFLFITGFYLYGIFVKYGWLEKPFMKTGVTPLSFLGRHSLIIYLLHQPVIFGVQEILKKFSFL